MVIHREAAVNALHMLLVGDIVLGEAESAFLVTSSKGKGTGNK